jgi:hypothetical protein
MALTQRETTAIALNVTRTRVTVLAFNLTIISVMLSLKATSGEFTRHDAILQHLPSTVALFVGFCVTLLGLWWLLVSQNQDEQGLSRPWPFTFGAVTTYLALSQTTSAFMQEYLAGLKAAIHAAEKSVSGSVPGLLGHDSLGHTAALTLLAMGAVTWFLVTYAAPLVAVVRGPLAGRRAWVFLVYYLAIQVPVFSVYAWTWHIASLAKGSETNLVNAFALQFVQPVLWFR